MELARRSGDAAALFGASASGDPRWIFGLLSFAAQAFKSEASVASRLLDTDVAVLRDNLSTWKSVKARATDIEARLAGKYGNSVFDLDLTALAAEWRDATNSVILVRNRKKKRVWGALAPFASHAMPADVGEEIGRLIELKKCRDESTRHEPTLSGFGVIWRDSRASQTNSTLT